MDTISTSQFADAGQMPAAKAGDAPTPCAQPRTIVGIRAFCLIAWLGIGIFLARLSGQFLYLDGKEHSAAPLLILTMFVLTAFFVSLFWWPSSRRKQMRTGDASQEQESVVSSQ